MSDSARPRITFVISPKLLPKPGKLGRTVLIDLAFAYGDLYFAVTRPFIDAMGDRIAAWVDHHSHPGWNVFAGDPRFVLVDRTHAPACPELVTPALVERVGAVDDLLAHGDFDGCVAAAKFLRGGEPPYPEADADARAVDAPGRGFRCSSTGERIALAMDHARERGTGAYLRLVARICDALVAGSEAADLTAELDRDAAAQRDRIAHLAPLVSSAEAVMDDVLLVRARGLSNTDRKVLLRLLEERSRVAVIDSDDGVTVGTYDDGLDVSEIGPLQGTSGLAWGKMPLDAVLDEVARLLS